MRERMKICSFICLFSSSDYLFTALFTRQNATNSASLTVRKSGSGIRFFFPTGLIRNLESGSIELGCIPNVDLRTNSDFRSRSFDLFPSTFFVTGLLV